MAIYGCGCPRTLLCDACYQATMSTFRLLVGQTKVVGEAWADEVAFAIARQHRANPPPAEWPKSLPTVVVGARKKLLESVTRDPRIAEQLIDACLESAASRWPESLRRAKLEPAA